MGAKATAATSCASVTTIPNWVPSGAAHYIAHTEGGQPIRALARAAGCHASTILRQIRKIELRRDDPLVDAALRKLGQAEGLPISAAHPRKQAKLLGAAESTGLPSDAIVGQEAMRVLRRLTETGAILAVAGGMDKAVVVREIPGASNTRTAVVDATVAEAMALQNWISPVSTGRVTRYTLTRAGRQALTQLIEEYGDLYAPSAEEATPATGDGDGLPGRPRYGMGETPLLALSRRRDKDGIPFLSDSLVQAGERLREDFELARIDGAARADWEPYLSGGAKPLVPEGAGTAATPRAARARVQAALLTLGPGLSDVVLHCCCYLEGLETTEKRLGWSARSGKVVLRIALTRLKRHYDETLGPGGPLIG